mmetsp:Transcript_30030/g.92969  ORF Transcript_30030/g.92969 Transcript_30030/m.92969 type:complete len:102 (-) Transcript_30030:488-793(-)
MKLEENEFLIQKLTSQCSRLQHENDKILTENGQLIDVVSALHISLAEAKGHAARNMEFLEHRVQDVEFKSNVFLARLRKQISEANFLHVVYPGVWPISGTS